MASQTKIRRENQKQLAKQERREQKRKHKAQLRALAALAGSQKHFAKGETN